MNPLCSGFFLPHKAFCDTILGMDRKKLLIRIVILMFLLFALDRLASGFYWYYTVWWFDMLMHFLGGLWVGLFLIYVISPKNSSLKTILNIILWLLVIGILWEAFEFWTRTYIGQTPFDILDTLSDVSFDVAGGFLAILYFFNRAMSPAGDTVQLK
jgi:hypothetical protein